MTLDNVRRLMLRFESDDNLRDRLVKARDQAEREAVLRAEDLYFTHAEFDEALNLLHFKCQTQEQADRFHEFRMWWDMLRRT